MKAGYYKLIDRECYISSHPYNNEIIKLYGYVLEVNRRGSCVGDDLGTTAILPHELQFFEYLGDTMPKHVQEKRTPKAGEVWSSFMLDGEEVFYNILEVDDGIVKYEIVSPYTLIYRLVTSCSIKSFMNVLIGYQGIPQYRTFSH